MVYLWQCLRHTLICLPDHLEVCLSCGFSGNISWQFMFIFVCVAVHTAGSLGNASQYAYYIGLHYAWKMIWLHLCIPLEQVQVVH